MCVLIHILFGIRLILSAITILLGIYAPYTFPYQIRILSFLFQFLSFINSYPYEFIVHYV